MDKLRIAVTGGSGYIGSRVVRYLAELGHAVVNVDQRPLPESTAPFIQADLRQRSQLQPILEKVDALCHLGEIPRLSEQLSPEEQFIHNTTVGAVVLQTAAELKLRRVIYTSTCQVYGCWGEPVIAPRCLPLDETHPYQPPNAYAAAKVANEQFAGMLARAHGLSVAIFRFPGVWGNCYEGAAELAWLDGYNGDGCGTYVGMDDVTRAYALALEHPRPGCETYHFSAAEVFSTAPLSAVLEQYYPGFPKLPADWPSIKSPVICDKAREHFGWTPQFNALEAFRKHVGRDPLPPRRPG